MRRILDKTMKVTLVILTIALTGLLTVSCEHKDLYYDELHTVTVNVLFDWQDAPDASPEGMCVFFYNEDGSLYRRCDFTGTTGGSVELPIGNFMAICYNHDTDGVNFSGQDNYYTHEAYTRDGSVFESVYGSAFNSSYRDNDDERVVITPDMMWGCTATDIEISSEGISYICVPEDEKDSGSGERKSSKEYTITLYPHQLVCEYSYEILNVKNLKYAPQMCGSLSALAPSLLFATEELGTECVTLPFAAISDGDSQITGGFYTFGNNESNDETHYLMLYVWMTDGNRYCYIFDVTDQVDGAADPRHVHIVIDGLELPQPIVNGSGLHPSVDGWQNGDEIYIFM